jgi:hypothetical protein
MWRSACSLDPASFYARLLARHGLTRVYTAACQVFAVISVTAGLTVWTNGHRLWWDENGQSRAWPAADPRKERVPWHENVPSGTPPATQLAALASSPPTYPLE